MYCGVIEGSRECKTDEEVLFLSDILPTGYSGVDMANVQPGDDVAVFGSGPIGCFAVMSSFCEVQPESFQSIIGQLV